MFIDSTYKPNNEIDVSDVTILDVAATAINECTRMSFKYKKKPTAKLIQLICYWAQGMSIVQNNRALFKDDFYLINGQIENPLIREILGGSDMPVTELPKEYKEQLKLPPDGGFSNKDSKMVVYIAQSLLSRNWDEDMKKLLKSSACVKALSNEKNIILKRDIKEYFDNLFMQTLKEGK